MGAVPNVADLCRDLSDEQGSLDSLLSGLGAGDWARPTPAEGWDVQDSLSHLCFFEEAAALAVTDRAGFEAHRARLVEELARAGGDGSRPDVALGRSLRDPALLLDRWRGARARYIEAVTEADAEAHRRGARLRVPWYGPDMSPESFTTARILEAWAHGVDIRDAVSARLEPSLRLRHVCHIGYGARAFSFAVHGMADPGDPVRLEVDAPDGTVWTWGPEDAADRVRGPALDVALVLAQRRHVSRTALQVTGPVAELWISIAQAFAGPPTTTPPDR